MQDDAVAEEILDAREKAIKDLLFAFIKIEDNTNFKFRASLSEGDSIIRRMRVELSRVRSKLNEMNRVAKPFKMKTVGIKRSNQATDAPEYWATEVVTIRKEVGGDDKALQEVDELFAELDMGAKFDGQ